MEIISDLSDQCNFLLNSFFLFKYEIIDEHNDEEHPLFITKKMEPNKNSL
jgi:hypothetical protein